MGESAAEPTPPFCLDPQPGPRVWLLAPYLAWVNFKTMPDPYRDFRELERAEPEGDAWTRDYVSRGSRTLVMAPHGGWIEPFTAELARAVAGNYFSLYAFQGLKKRGNESLHLTSHRFDEPLALQAVASAEWVVAIHGERSSDREFVMVGGLWQLFRESLAETLEGADIAVVSPREGLGGVNPRNICNRGQTRMVKTLVCSAFPPRTAIFF